MMFWIRKEQGRLYEIAPALELFMRHRPSDVWRPGLALLFAELEREEEARREFQSLAIDRFSAVARDALETCALAYLADVCVYVEDRENAGHLYERLKRFGDRTISLGVANILIGPASRYIGELATLMGEWEEAERHFEDAMRMADQMKAPTQLAHIRFLYGSMLQRRGGPGDWHRARTLLNDSLRTALELRMRKLAGKASAALTAREIDQPAVRYLPAGLSQREVDVLRLMATGLGNREIGQALFITPNTVANHVKRILQKTGAANRTEAAAFAVRNRLFEP
jgi:DNA-binding CsgD family transcriptional regulator